MENPIIKFGNTEIKKQKFFQYNIGIGINNMLII